MKITRRSVLCCALLATLLISSTVHAFPRLSFEKGADGNVQVTVGDKSVLIDMNQVAKDAKKAAETVQGALEDAQDALENVNGEEVKAKHDAFVEAHKPAVEEMVTGMTDALKAAGVEVPAACAAKQMGVASDASDAKEKAAANTNACLDALRAEGAKVHDVLVQQWRQHHPTIGGDAAVVRTRAAAHTALAQRETEGEAMTNPYRRPSILKHSRQPIPRTLTDKVDADEEAAGATRNPLIQPRRAAQVFNDFDVDNGFGLPVPVKDEGKGEKHVKPDQLHGAFVGKSREITGRVDTQVDVVAEDNGAILSGGAVTGLVVALVFASLLMLLVCMEAVPIFMDSLRSRGHPEGSDGAPEKTVQVEVCDA